MMTRRTLLVRTIQIVAGASLLPVLQAGDVATAYAQARVTAEDVVDSNDGLRRGSAQGVEVVGGPGGLAVRPTAERGVFTSAPLHASIPFTHLGLHWSATVPRGAALSFEVRTSLDRSGWSAWEPVEIEREPSDTPVGDAFGSLLFVGEARSFQYRATFRGARGGPAALRRVTASLVQSRAGGGGTTPPRTTTIADSPSGRSLAVVRREDWAADETTRFKNGQEVWPEMFVPAKKLIVHHTATRNSYKTAADAAADVRAILQYHAVNQQWGDVGYTAIVDKFGNVYEGRHGRGGDPADTLVPREILSPGAVAAHDTYHNYGSVGVALLGDATRRDWPMTSASGPMWDALVRYATFEAGRHFLRPVAAGGAGAASNFLRSDGAWTPGMANVSGHKETNATACPGTPVMNLLPALRSAIQNGLTGVSRTGATLTVSPNPGLSAVPRGTPLTYTWQAETPEAGWQIVGYEYCWERWFKPSGADDIQYRGGYTAEQQPRPAWTAVEATVTSLTVIPDQPGHATFHVRAVLGGAAGTRRGAYEGIHTVLVT